MGGKGKGFAAESEDNMSEATRYTIFLALVIATFTAWGMITHDLYGTVWYWAAGVLLAGLSEFWIRQIEKISKEKAQPFGFFRFGPMMVYLIIRWICKVCFPTCF
ncbi:MAG TPA: hypothetical protein DCP22_03465 [Ruminococcaceae bacterium]|nr:hypothetical protein [Oscillospiraceae bacterium]